MLRASPKIDSFGLDDIAEAAGFLGLLLDGFGRSADETFTGGLYAGSANLEPPSPDLEVAEDFVLLAPRVFAGLNGAAKGLSIPFILASDMSTSLLARSEVATTGLAGAGRALEYMSPTRS